MSVHYRVFLYVFYPQIWQTFVRQQYCLGALRRDYPEWHKNRERYYVWAIDADMAVLNARLQKYRDILRNCIISPYPRQPHITIAVAGFLAQTPQHDDDIGADTIENQIAQLESLALLPFELTVGGINSFVSAPFLEVDDSSRTLEKIRQVLTRDVSEFRTSAYVPHITIGIYNGDHLSSALAGVMHDLHEEPLAIAVNRIGLYSYDASDIGSLLQQERRVEFSGGRK